MSSRVIVLCCIVALLASVVPSQAVFIYVSKTGSSIPPYGSWASAATSLHAAVSVATDYDQILISNGTFAITGEVWVTRPLTIRSMNGPLFTTIDGLYPVRTNRCFRMTHANGILEGLTIKNGCATGTLSGGGVMASPGGEINNCIVTDNRAAYGGGIYISQGTVRDCAVTRNTTSNEGGGLYLHSALATAEYCRIYCNTSAYYGGGASLQAGSKLRNNLIYRNQARWGGGFATWVGGKAENCTVANNRSVLNGGPGDGGGGCWLSHTSILINCAIRFNWSGATEANIVTQNMDWTYTVGSNCVSAPALPGTANMNVNPDFVDITNDNYRLRWTSLCIDHGRSLPGTASGVDIYGNARSLGANVDIGAVEFGNVVNDFNYDGKSDLTVWDPNSGKWYITQVQGAILALGSNWGFAGCTPESGVGEGGAGMPIFHPASGNWYVRTLEGEVVANGVNWGYPGCTAVMEDYNGGGTDDAAVYDLNNGNWYIKTLDNVMLVSGTNWGYKGCVPVAGDYNGDGDADLAVYDANSGNWFIRTINGDILAFGRNWGFKGCVPVPGDYDGDGKSDLAVYHSASGNWYIQTLAGSTIASGRNWGFAGCTPISGDYNGDGFNDLAVFHNTSGNWYIQTLGGVNLAVPQNWGWNGVTAVTR